MTDLPGYDEVARLFDHAILKPDLTRSDIDDAVNMAKKYRIFSLCVRPSDVAYVAEQLRGSDVKTITVIGFPHGTTSTAAKVAEAQQAARDGAVEFDIVQNIGWAKSGFFDLVEQDLRAVSEAVGGALTKVILETTLLTDEEIVASCQAAERAGINFVKTSTGFAGGGATIPDVKLMRASVGPNIHVKASGGVRTLADVQAMVAEGVSRIGTSSGAQILDELEALRRGETPIQHSEKSDY